MSLAPAAERMKSSWRRWALAGALGLVVSFCASADPASGTAPKASPEQLEREWRETVVARLQRSPRARDLLLASILSPWVTAEDRETRAVLMRRAMANAGDDPLVWWLGANDCPAATVVCDAPRARAKLRQIAPDNAAVWWLGVRVQNAADGSTTVLATDLALDAHLQGAAAATHYDNYLDDLLRELVQAMVVDPPPPALLASLDADTFGAAPTPTHVAFVDALGRALAVAMPSYGAIAGVCREPLIPARRELCLRALRTQVAQAEDLVTDGVAISTLLRLLPPGAERDAMLAHRRERAWQQAAWIELQQPAGVSGPLDSDQIECYVAESLQPQGSELSAMRACLEKAGIAPTPPPQWTRDGDAAAAPAPN